MNILNLVLPPKTSGRFAEAQHLFNKFLQESDLQAAQRCIDIYRSLLADSFADVKSHNSDSAASTSKFDDEWHPIGSHRHYHILIQLAHTLMERYLYAGDTLDLESAARHGEEALALCQVKRMVCPTVWVFYANILAVSFEATTNPGELRMAEMLCREAMPLCSTSHPLSSVICHALSWITLRQFGQSGNEALIKEAVDLQRVGLERLPETESQDRHRHLRRLAQALKTKQLYGESQDTNVVLSIVEEAFRICPPMHVDRWALHSEMIGQLLVAYYHSGELELMNRSIELGRQALSTGKFLHSERRALVLFHMAESLRIRHETSGTNDKDIEESVALFREVLRISPPGHVNHCSHLYTLAVALTLQFRSDGDIGHLEEACQLYHHASDIMSTAHPRRYYVVHGYATCLGLRFEETGDISELNRAIDLGKEAVAAFQPATLNHTDSARQMISHLCLRFAVLRDDDDVKNAVKLAEELLEGLPDSDINRLEATVILAKARLLRAVDTEDSGGVDLAVEELLSIKGKLLQSSSGPEGLRILSSCYVIKFRQSLDVAYSLRAKDAMDEVLESVNPDHYEHFQCLIDAAKLYMEQGTPYCNMDIALKYLSDALENTHRDVRSKIRGAKDILVKLEEEHRNLFNTTSSTSSKLLEIIENAVLLLPRIAFFGIHAYSRLQSLKEGQTIAMTGASLALNLSRPEKALEIMEQGRATFWTHTLRLRSPFSEIPEDLRHRLSSLARRLENAVGASTNSADQRHMEGEITRRRKESEEFNSLVDQARCLPGHERFMLPDEYSALKVVAKKGPVVVLVCSTIACHAIILMPSEKTYSIPLEAVTDKWLVESTSAWRSTVTEARSALTDDRKLAKSKKASGSTCARAERILRLLWINVVFPVIQALHTEVC
jgi:tetratricopeptide (TPR) repeat protein